MPFLQGKIYVRKSNGPNIPNKRKKPETLSGKFGSVLGWGVAFGDHVRGKAGFGNCDLLAQGSYKVGFGPCRGIMPEGGDLVQ